MVVKQFGDHADVEGGRERYPRETTGLRTLPGTPEPLAADDARLLVVMSDVGTGPTLADLLLGGHRDAAWDRALGWAESFGTLLAARWTRSRSVDVHLVAQALDQDHDAAPGLVISPGDACPDNAVRTDDGWRRAVDLA